jgi:hypothetical protein
MNGYSVYLLHIEPPYKHAGHYIGVTRKGREIATRWIEHMDKHGSVLTRHARRAGCQLILSRIWLNAEFAMEKRLKGRGVAPLCPICRRRNRGRRAVIVPASTSCADQQRRESDDERSEETATGNSGAIQ